jgi:hypothetical protein
MDDTSFSGKVLDAQIKYLDKTISTYASVSDTGRVYEAENLFLDEEAKKMKEQIWSGRLVLEDEKNSLIKHFQTTCKDFGVYGFDIFDDAQNLQIVTYSDVDFFRLYVKNYLVARLLNNKLLPKDIWSTVASSEQWVIQDGEEFQVQLATVACNRQRRNDWFRVKENKEHPLTKENILDTLQRNVDCQYTYKTKNYKKGENRLIFINKIPYNDNSLSKEVVFYVK